MVRLVLLDLVDIQARRVHPASADTQVPQVSADILDSVAWVQVALADIQVIALVDSLDTALHLDSQDILEQVASVDIQVSLELVHLVSLDIPVIVQVVLVDTQVHRDLVDIQGYLAIRDIVESELPASVDIQVIQHQDSLDTVEQMDNLVSVVTRARKEHPVSADIRASLV